MSEVCCEITESIRECGRSVWGCGLLSSTSDDKSIRALLPVAYESPNCDIDRALRLVTLGPRRLKGSSWISRRGGASSKVRCDWSALNCRWLWWYLVDSRRPKTES